MAQKHEPITKREMDLKKYPQNQKQQNRLRTTALELGQVLVSNLSEGGRVENNCA